MGAAWLAVGLLGSGQAVATEPPRVLPPTARDMARELGFDEDQLLKLREGEIVSKVLAEGHAEELALAVAMIVPLTPQTIFEQLDQGQFFAVNRTVLKVGELSAPDVPETTAADLAELQLPSSELVRLRKFRGGSAFNLSKSETQRIRKVAKGPAHSVQHAYRQILAERLREYVESGTGSLSPYHRGHNKEVYPDRDLRTAVKALSHLNKRSSDFFRALRDYPMHPTPNVKHRFFWLIQDLMDRPTAVLSHWAMQLQPDHALVAERQFYVGQSYNALQIAGGAFAIGGDRSLVFYTNRTATDQLSSFMGGAARAIGERMMLGEIVSLFESIREAIQTGSPPLARAPR